MSDNLDPITAAAKYAVHGIQLPNPNHVERWNVLAPPSTHRDEKTCKAIDCERYREGWVTVLVEALPQFQQAADHVRRVSGLRFAEAYAAPGGSIEVRDYGDVGSEEVQAALASLTYLAGATYFIFPPGQNCFEPHTERNDRPFIFQHAIGYGAHLRDRKTISGNEFVERSQESFGRTADLIKRERG